MTINKNYTIISFAILVLLLAIFQIYDEDDVDLTSKNKIEESREFRKYGLETNTTKASIELDKVLSGGPGKDGIPALFYPAFQPLDEVDIDDEVRGVFIEIDGEKKYYPYTILVWHEIVNDKIADKEIAVTFCPLCGTGIVYDRLVDGQVLQFGVSGLLFESNLLMYDKETESLWSQARGEAVIGKLLGKELTVLSMQLISFKELKSKHPDVLVLSDDTGYSRDYSQSPYGDYEENDDVYFPVSVDDKRFKAKELMLVVPYMNKSLAMLYSEILSNDNVVKKIEGSSILIKKDGEEIYILIDGEEYPFYFEMWFSWVNHHEGNGVVL